MGAHGFESQGDVGPELNASYTELRKRGFYQAASWSWDGEWYAGVDRVPYLEAALARATGESPPPVLAHRAEPPAPARLTGVAERPVVDFWFSFRSPYSYLALGPVAELAARWPIDLRLRPVLPMVTRGLAVPAQKRMYIVRDAKREADRRGVPFGHICDPLGKGVEHAMAIAKHAIDAGRGLDFLASAARGTWSEALDLASYVDLRAVVERAGLDWDDGPRGARRRRLAGVGQGQRGRPRGRRAVGRAQLPGRRLRHLGPGPGRSPRRSTSQAFRGTRRRSRAGLADCAGSPRVAVVADRGF